ncbi:hypothetical protein ACIQVO_35985 [Streptomyces sp. NPDC101062]|uniref:hypothetical protein n=1 Tax=unclassified Streptomyces TaxID=2593676 RepID=UPI00381EFD4D
MRREGGAPTESKERTMSVTFSPAYVPSSAFVISCTCPKAKASAPQHPTYDAALAAYPAEPLQVELPGCEYPGRCRPFILGLDPHDDVPQVNLANANARRVLETLGLTDYDTPGDHDDTLTGQRTAEDFIGHVLIALALTPFDTGIPAVQDGNCIDLGRPAGYLQDRLADLHNLASWCAAHDRAVSWG